MKAIAKSLVFLVLMFVASSSRGDEKSKELDRKLIGFLLAESEIVVKAHKDTNGMVGMDPRMKQRYGLPAEDTGFWLALKDTLVGTKVEGERIGFWCTRGGESEPFFLAQGDYLLFLKHDAQKRWVLVADYLGLQPLTKGLDQIVLALSKK